MFYLNEIYRPHLEHMVNLAGVKIKKTDNSKLKPITKPSITPLLPSVGKKAPFRSKMVKFSEIDILKNLQREIKISVENFKVNEEGSVIFLDLSSLTLKNIPESINSFLYLMEINFSDDSFETDMNIRDLVFNGKDIKINGKPYVDGQIEARIRQEEEEIKRRKNENQNIIIQAQQKLKERQWNDAINLFRKSKEISSQQGWSDGVSFAEKMILEAEEKIRKEAEEKAKKEKIEKEKQLKIKYQNLANEAQQKFVERQWDSAIALFNNATEVCQKLKFTDGLNFAEDMIVKARENAKKEVEEKARKEAERSRQEKARREAQERRIKEAKERARREAIEREKPFFFFLKV